MICNETHIRTPFDVQFTMTSSSIDAEYFADTDTLTFTLDDKVVYDQSDEVVPGFLVDYGVNCEIIRIDIWTSAVKLQEVVQVKSSYKINREHGHICIFLSDQSLEEAKETPTEDDRIKIIVDNDGRYVAIRILNTELKQDCLGT